MSEKDREGSHVQKAGGATKHWYEVRYDDQYVESS